MHGIPSFFDGSSFRCEVIALTEGPTRHEARDQEHALRAGHIRTGDSDNLQIAGHCADLRCTYDPVSRQSETINEKRFQRYTSCHALCCPDLAASPAALRPGLRCFAGNFGVSNIQRFFLQEVLYEALGSSTRAGIRLFRIIAPG